MTKRVAGTIRIRNGVRTVLAPGPTTPRRNRIDPDDVATLAAAALGKQDDDERRPT